MEMAVSHLPLPHYKPHPVPVESTGDRRRPSLDAQNGHEVPVKMLSDAEVLALSYSYMALIQQEELSDLLADQREGVIDSAGRKRLAELLEMSNQGLLRKAEALVEALLRGLKAPLSKNHGT